MIDEMISATTATIYVTAGQDSPTGPFGWVARTITPEGFSELRGHDRGPFARLYVVGTIKALDVLPQGSTVRVISSSEYLIKHILARIDDLVAGRVKTKGNKKPLANRDLFAEVLRARDRHTKVSTEREPADERDAEHDEAAASLLRLLDEVKAAGDAGEPVPVHEVRKAEAEHKGSAENEIISTQTELDQVTSSHISQDFASRLGSG